MRNAKIIAYLLCFAIVGSMFVGCTKEPETSEVQPSSEISVEIASEAPEKIEEANKDEELLAPAISAWVCAENWETVDELTSNALLTFYHYQFIKEGEKKNHEEGYEVSAKDIIDGLSKHFETIDLDKLTRVNEEEYASARYIEETDTFIISPERDPIGFKLVDTQKEGNKTVFSVLVYRRDDLPSYLGLLTTEKTADGYKYLSNQKTDLSPEGSSGLANPEGIMTELNEFLQTQKNYEPAAIFDKEYTCYEYESLIIYHTTGIMGYNTIVAMNKETEELKLVDLGDYSNFTVKSIAPDYEDSNVLRVFSESQSFGGDYLFMDFPSEVFYSLEEEKVISIQYQKEAGTYGMVHSLDYQSFDQSAVNENVVSFTFALRAGGNGNGYKGPEIIIRPYYINNSEPFVAGFRNTELNLEEGFVEQIKNIEGVKEAGLIYIDTELFTGTQLTILPEEGYEIDSYFNGSGFADTLENFNVKVFNRTEA